MLVVPVIENLEHVLEVAALLDCNSLQFMITNNGYIKVIANRAKICHLKFATKLLFKGVNNGSTANNLDIIYVD